MYYLSRFRWRVFKISIDYFSYCPYLELVIMFQFVSIVYYKTSLLEENLTQIKKNWRMNKQQKYEVIKSLVDHGGKQENLRIKTRIH